MQGIYSMCVCVCVYFCVCMYVCVLNYVLMFQTLEDGIGQMEQLNDRLDVGVWLADGTVE